MPVALRLREPGQGVLDLAAVDRLEARVQGAQFRPDLPSAVVEDDGEVVGQGAAFATSVAQQCRFGAAAGADEIPGDAWRGESALLGAARLGV